MGPRDLAIELEARGLVLSHVGQDRRNPHVLLVYLHGPAGQWAKGQARQTIRSVPGVVAATESVQTPTIILVQVQGPGDASPAAGPGDRSW